MLNLHVKGFATVQQGHDGVGPSLQEVVHHLTDQPAALSSAGLHLVPKLKTVTGQQVSPKQKNNLVKELKQQG